MPNIDISVSTDLSDMFQLPSCADISLPPPRPLKISLPGGGTLKSFSDISKGIPTDCAMTFSMLMQLGPFLASIECLVKVLKLVNTVIEVLKGVKLPTDILTAIPKIIAAAEPVLECALSFTPAGLIPFIRDLLCVILKVLKCFLSQMTSVVKILDETTLQIQAATADGNAELMQTLQCAQTNAMTQAAHLTSSIEVVGVILELAGDFMQIVGLKPIQLPSTSGIVDVNGLKELVKTFQTFVVTLQTIVDALGGCGS